MPHTWIEIDTKAIKHNLAQFRKLLGKNKLLMPVVKANAYGHGIFEIAKICDQDRGVDRICVVNDDEAQLLLESGIKKPIMILSFYDLTDEYKMYSLVRAGVIFPIYRVDQIETLNKIGETTNKKIKVQLKIDTGAGRVGILPKDALDFGKKISASKFLNLEGLWSHFASSESDGAYTKQQHSTFKQTVNQLEKIGIKIPVKHMACSASTVLFPQEYNAARIGLSTYGLYPSPKAKKKINLKPALSWHTRIIQIKTLPEGSKISYGGTYTAKVPITLAVLPVGYYDGYDRSGMSNTAKVIIKGKLCPIRGRVCMNLCMADITGLKGVGVGDKATLIGSQGKAAVSADDLAKWAGTINYEIVDKINPLLPRIYTK
ncbi:MAG: alanine racemase [Candidatus Magasanikbacteria bacterium RIFOXYD2_FULL_41_14]|uniref:Alanine racemase n=1 Tax=Candidatus Magasanikbacteria bacterium RIFOXYD2_FULL_41_14 TaxID=1798709 RepID=A0A1F6PGC0_9BACT|nr:MAG: alanine racemase [Candidatus Magasanikbacteria bacterium RIFOXYD2_FULL_41_14]